jgi:hypothetical protein
VEHNVYVERDIWRERAEKAEAEVAKAMGRIEKYTSFCDAYSAEVARLRASAEAALRLCGFCLGGGSIWVDEDGKRRCETPESRPPYRPVPCPACGPIRRALDAADAPAGGPEDSGEGCDA